MGSPTRPALLRSSELARTPYAHAAVVPRSAQLLLAAGACPIDRAGATVCPGDVPGQAHRVMTNLAVALAAGGSSLSDVVSTTIYVATSARDDLVAAWDVVHDRFADHEPPSTLVGVTVLGYPDQLVEVTAIALVPDGSGDSQPGSDDSQPGSGDSQH